MSTPDAASADLKPIFAAALQGNLSAITANIADANAATADGYTPLQLAVSAGQEQAAALLLREGVSVNAADNTGVTALMHAAMHGHSGIVDTLLLHGADARLKRADGQTAVGLAAAQKKGVLNKTTWLQYNAIEEEPSVPATNLIGQTHNAD